MANPILETLQAKLDQTEARYHPSQAPVDPSSDRGMIRVYRDPVTGTARLRPLETVVPVGSIPKDPVTFPRATVFDPVPVPRNDFNAMVLKLLIAMDDKLNQILDSVPKTPKRARKCVTSSPPSSGASGN